MSDRPKERLTRLEEKNPEAYNYLEDLRKGHLTRLDFMKIAAGMVGVGALGALAGWRWREAYVSGPPSVTLEASYVIGIQGTTIFARNGKTGEIDYSGTDAPTVIQSAMNALTNGRTWKEKVLLKGNFSISSTIKVPSYIILEIQGKLTLGNGLNINMIENSDQTGGNTDIEIIGGYFDGNSANQSGGAGCIIEFDNVQRSKIVEGYFTAAYNYCLNLLNSTDITCEGLIASLGGGDDDFSISTNCSRVTFIDCLSLNHPGTFSATRAVSGFEVEDNAQDIMFIGCSAISDESDIAQHYGFHVHTHERATAPSRVTFIGCTAVGNGRTGFRIGGLRDNKVTKVTLVGCHARRNRLSGIWGAYADEVRVLGGALVDHKISGAAYGMYLNNDCDNWLVEGVVFENNSTYDVQIATSDCDNNRFVYNHFKSTTPLSDSGTETIIVRNVGYTRSLWLQPFWAGTVAQTGTANRVHLQPLWVPEAATISEVSFSVDTASSGKSMRIGIYVDNNGTPAGSALLFDSGNIDVSSSGGKTVTVSPPVNVKKGWVWVALATEDATMAFIRSSDTPLFASNATTPMVDGCRYTLGSWGALTNPCPTVAQDSQARPTVLVYATMIY